MDLIHIADYDFLKLHGALNVMSVSAAEGGWQGHDYPRTLKSHQNHFKALILIAT